MQVQLNKNWKTKFFSIWIGQAFSLLGSQIVQFTLIWYLTKETGSATVLATSTLVSLLPNVLLAPFIGALVDRWDRKRIMIIADLLIALVTLILILLFRVGKIQIWHIYLAMFLREFGSTFHWPSMRSSTSLLVPKENMARVEGMNQTIRGLLNVVGPPLAAILLDLTDIHNILAIDIITAFLAVTPLLFVAIPQPAQDQTDNAKSASSLLQDMKLGFRYLKNWKGMLLLTFTATLINFLVNPGFTLTPLLVTQHFQGGAFQLSLVESVFGIGVISGGVLLSTWGGFKKRILTTITAIIGMGGAILLIAFASPSQFNLALAGMLLTGFTNPIVNGSITAIMQTNVKPEMQGRVFTTLNSLANAMSPFSMLIAAPVAEIIGIQGWFLVGGLGCIIMGIFGLLNPDLMNIEEEGQRRQQAEKAS
ncbi:MAG TPA: MFS transporter [Anaerolineaceae bacterium]|uniref:Multidrug resistance protein n=1 Tax=Anaerolinea thermophila TaxID=167964 RepID=A0A117LH32_9CHLR|nr:MAG: Multidrug resistance protein [Anaerolinea thermophila]HAF61725.1 MFS transporter [Anaerolineaceae bacterium]